MPFVIYSIYLYYLLNSTWINLGEQYDSSFLIIEAGIFQCNFSSIYSNICLLFKKNFRSLNKIKKENAIGLAQISQYTNWDLCQPPPIMWDIWRSSLHCVFTTPTFSWPHLRGNCCYLWGWDPTAEISHRILILSVTYFWAKRSKSHDKCNSIRNKPTV